MGIALKFVLIREIRVTPYCNTYGSEDLPKRNGRPRRFFHLLNFINNFSGALAQIGIITKSLGKLWIRLFMLLNALCRMQVERYQ